jgi:hypothetical protein
LVSWGFALLGRSENSPVFGTGKSCPEYYFHFPSVFLRVPAGELVEQGGKTLEKRRFRRDPLGSGLRNDRPGYCSTFQTYFNEREKLRMALLVNKYPIKFIDQQFNRMLKHFNINEPLNINNYNTLRQKVIANPFKEKVPP